MRQASWVLAAIAVVMVVVTGGVLGHAAATRGSSSASSTPAVSPPVVDLSTPTTPTPTPSDAASPQGAFDPETVVYGNSDANAEFEVPKTADWQVSSADTFLGYADKKGNPLEGVFGGATYLDDFCKVATVTTSSRAFVGFTRGADGTDAGALTAGLAASWVSAISLDTTNNTHTHHTPITSTPLTLSSGATATEYSSVIDVDQQTSCDAPQEQFTMLSLATGANTANLVMVRDLGPDDALDADTAMKILSSLQQELAVPPSPSSSASPGGSSSGS